MAERYRCPPGVEAGAEMRLVGCLAGRPANSVVAGRSMYRAVLQVADRDYALVSYGERDGLTNGRPGDCLRVIGSAELHDQRIDGKSRYILTVTVKEVERVV